MRRAMSLSWKARASRLAPGICRMISADVRSMTSMQRGLVRARSFSGAWFMAESYHGARHDPSGGESRREVRGEGDVLPRFNFFFQLVQFQRGALVGELAEQKMQRRLLA